MAAVRAKAVDRRFLERLWYVAAVHEGHEATARAELERCAKIYVQSWETLLPTITVTGLSTAGVVTQKKEPCFPGYIFVHLHLARDTRWRSVNGVRGVVHLLPISAEMPIPVPAALMEKLLDAEAAGGAQVDARPRYARGEQVRIKEGLCVGQIGFFDSIVRKNKQERAKLLLAILGGGSVEVPLEHTEAVA